MIRLEAVALIHYLYTYQRVEVAQISQIYQLMAIIAIGDLHLEVRRKVLEFWEEIILDSLKNQGMIDGNFPDVTFSKEHKKIVKLNENEIRKRLHIVLNELKENGCLQVLIKSIKDDAEIEVARTAVRITNTFTKLLKRYKIFNVEKEDVIYNEFFSLMEQDLSAFLCKRKNLISVNNLDLLLKDVIQVLKVHT